MNSETAPLLPSAVRGTSSDPITSNNNPGRLMREEHIIRVLPIAFTAAFAIAATSATTVFAYASLMCKDASNCNEDEKKRYSGVVAIATAIANVCGVLAVSVLRPYTISQPRIGLFFWLTCRSVSICFLVVGVLLKSIYIAVVGRIFEGMATDNVLHYTLGAVYVKSKDPAAFARLMGTSLALYMSAMSMSPTIVTLLPNFVWSFGVSIALLGASLVYLAVYVPIAVRVRDRDRDPGQEQSSTQAQTYAQLSRSILEPLLHFYRVPFSILPGMAMFSYNAAQAYLFPAIMVHASIRFGFTSRENGYLISIAALTSSVYLFFVLFAIPRFIKWPKATARRDKGTTGIEESVALVKPTEQPRLRRSDVCYALISMLVQLVVLPCVTLVDHARDLYGLVVLIALGLSAPSFIKSYAVTSANSKNSVLAGMAIMESFGGLASPIVLGVIQSVTNEGMVFAVASGLVAGAMLCLIASLFCRRG